MGLGSKAGNSRGIYSEKTVIQSGENALSALLEKPEGACKDSKRPLVIIMHGITVNKNMGLYRQIADRLLKGGAAVLSFDFNGHGESSGKDYEMTIPKEIEDAAAVYSYAEKLDFVSDIIFLGHSQGGLVAGLAASRLGSGKVPYLIQLAPAAVAKDFRNTGLFGGRKIFDPKHLPEKLTISNNFTIGRNYIETAAAADPYGEAAKYTGKVLLIQGENDIMVPMEYAEKYRKAYKDCSFIAIGGEVHNFSVKTGELLNYIEDFVFAAGFLNAGRQKTSFMDIAKKRYSVRKFSGRPIEKEKLNIVLEAASAAPTAKNQQPQRIYILQSKESLEKLDTLTHCRYGAGTVLLFTYNKDEDWQNPLENGIRSGIEDASISAAHAMLQAAELGLGTCWCNYFENSRLEKIFSLPENEKAVLIMPIGYAADSSKPAPAHWQRKEIKEIIRHL